MIEFISAVYNESAEIDDLLSHIYPYVDRINIVDDGSTDGTWNRLVQYSAENPKFTGLQIPHTGLCEVARIEALKLCQDGSWVIMLDADERFAPGVLDQIIEFVKAPPEGVTHVYFKQREFIDGTPVAEWPKVKLFLKNSAYLPEIIHKDPSFSGNAHDFGGMVIHRKSSSKQVMRELEYLETYDKLLDAGKVTQSDVNWFKGMHHFVRERHG